jgi:hypothetical protein
MYSSAPFADDGSPMRANLIHLKKVKPSVNGAIQETASVVAGYLATYIPLWSPLHFKA